MNSPGLLSLPNELLLEIIDMLSGGDVCDLTRVASRIRTVAIQFLLSQHGISEAQVASGVITISGLYILVLGPVFFALPISKVRCIFEGAYPQRFASLASRLPCIWEVVVSGNSLKAAIVRRLIPDPSASLLILKHGYFVVSTPDFTPNSLVRPTSPKSDIWEVGLINA